MRHESSSRKRIPTTSPMLPHSSASPGSELQHFLLTRFNLRASESHRPPDEAWLTNRTQLFGQFTVPSVRAQLHRQFSWIIFCDVESPDWLIDFLRNEAAGAEVVLLPVFSAPLIADVVATRLISRARVVTTRLDNDDAIGRDFMATVYREAVFCDELAAINVLNGCQFGGETLCLRSDPSNAFISLVEDPSESTVRTVFDMQHQQWIGTGRVRQVVTEPMWMQVIHGGNARNRLSGIATRPSVVQPQFAVSLPADPSRVELARLRLTSFARLAGRIVRSPRRMVWLSRVASARLGRARTAGG